jgi:hypothetical protein
MNKGVDRMRIDKWIGRLAEWLGVREPAAPVAETTPDETPEQELLPAATVEQPEDEEALAEPPAIPAAVANSSLAVALYVTADAAARRALDQLDPEAVLTWCEHRSSAVRGHLRVVSGPDLAL